jgi:hypothetical protein
MATVRYTGGMDMEPIPELEAIKAAAAAATPGPWWSDESENCWRLHGVAFVVPPQPDGLIPEQQVGSQILKAPKHGTPYAEYWPNAADAEFITGAREFVPRLVSAIEAVLELTDAPDKVLLDFEEVREAIIRALQSSVQ